MDLEQLAKDLRELSDKIVDIMSAYEPVVCATALWSISGSLIGNQNNQDIDILVNKFCDNMRQAAIEYREYIKQKSCTHGGEEDEG